jgi:hypothetical protein
MTREYLIGELSVLLERLQRAALVRAEDVGHLREQVESRPASWLPVETDRALALADEVCWDSLSRGDVGAFDGQAAISADLRLFGICARLLDDQ